MSSVVYTALMGEYEALIEQPIAHTSGLRFVCFTDNRDLVSDTWEVVYQPARFPWDPTRSARYLKILGPPDRNAHESSLWIDNRVVLTQKPEDLLNSWLDGVGLTLPHHSYRTSVMDEFTAVLRVGYDQPDRVREQLRVMQEWYPEVLNQRPYWTGMLARRHEPAVWEAMALWMDLVLRHSRRDQLSVNLALTASGQVPRVLPLDNHGSMWHDWMVVEKREAILFGAGQSYQLRDHVKDAALRRAKVMKHRYAAWRRDH